ncbi:MAG: diacylglycerol kinase family protein [Asticcacaulis sp.]
MTQTVYNILINQKSGTVLNIGVEAIESAIEASGIQVDERVFADPEDMQDQLERLSRKSTPLLIGGGDGTLRESAKYLARRKKAFGVLPFGTMNLLAKDLGLGSLQEALDAYARGSTEDIIDAGFVNGEIFLCCASIGTMPKASVFREENRNESNLLLFPRLFLFVVNHLDKNKRQRIRMTADGRNLHFRAAAVVVSNNRFAGETGWTESNFKRASLTSGELAVYASTTQTSTSHLRLLLSLIFGNWLKDPDLSEIIAKKVSLQTRRRVELVSIDGEIAELPTPLVFTLKPKLLHVLIPVPAQPPVGAPQ